MPILVLVEKVVCLFCALSGLIMPLPARTTNKTSLKSFWDALVKSVTGHVKLLLVADAFITVFKVAY